MERRGVNVHNRGPSGVKKTMNLCAVILLAGFGLSLSSVADAACNEAVCAPIVSYCTLLKLCDCFDNSSNNNNNSSSDTNSDDADCECCGSCVKCFETDYLFTECCSCIEGLCPDRNVTEEARPDHMFDFVKPADPKIWKEVVKGGFPEWETITFPMEQDTILPSTSDLMTANCSVTYQKQSTSLERCVESCRTMGAKSGRWFGESGGCCECVGHECADYDDSEPPRSQSCSREGNEETLDLLSDSEWDQLSDSEQEQFLESLRDEVNRLESQQRRRLKRDSEHDQNLEDLRIEINRLESRSDFLQIRRTSF